MALTTAAMARGPLVAGEVMARVNAPPPRWSDETKSGGLTPELASWAVDTCRTVRDWLEVAWPRAFDPEYVRAYPRLDRDLGVAERALDEARFRLHLAVTYASGVAEDLAGWQDTGRFPEVEVEEGQVQVHDQAHVQELLGHLAVPQCSRVSGGARCTAGASPGHQTCPAHHRRR